MTERSVGKRAFPDSPQKFVLSGPHIFAGNPLNKTPRRRCRLNSDYDSLDLTTLPDDYLPRTNYVPACSPHEYRRRTPGVPWMEITDNEPSRVSDHYRLVNRELVNPARERTLISALVPKHVAVINTVITSAFQDPVACVDVAAMSFSVVTDFFVKTSGTVHISQSWLSRLPILNDACPFKVRLSLRLRALALSCLTTRYADLWRDICATPDTDSRGRGIDAFRRDAWTKADPRLPADFFSRPHARMAPRRRTPHRLRPPAGARRD